MSEVIRSRVADVAARKARGAFFTPEGITRHLAVWAIRSAEDRELEPSTGETAFLIPAVERLTELGNTAPAVDGVEIHPPSARAAHALISAAGGTASITVSDFFMVEASAALTRLLGTRLSFATRTGPVHRETGHGSQLCSRAWRSLVCPPAGLRSWRIRQVSSSPEGV